jgi:hypothetical protein
MFKPVRVIATVVFLAMIIMIFISAFVIGSSTLCISKHRSVVASVYLLKRGMQYSSCSSTSRSSGIRCRTFPTRVPPSSECSALLKCFHRVSVITLYHPSSACLGCLLVMLSRVICFVLDTCTGFIFCVVRSSLFNMPCESEVVKLLASISHFYISATFTRKKAEQNITTTAIKPLAAIIPRSCSSMFSTCPLFRRGMRLVPTL